MLKACMNFTQKEVFMKIKDERCKHDTSLLVDGSCFTFSSNKKSFADAHLYCRSQGGKLAEPQNLAAFNTIMNHPDKITGWEESYWIGLLDPNNGQPTFASSGQTILYNPQWYRGEPNSPAEQNYVLWPKQGLVDVSVQDKFKLICQVDY